MGHSHEEQPNRKGEFTSGVPVQLEPVVVPGFCFPGPLLTILEMIIFDMFYRLLKSQELHQKLKRLIIYTCYRVTCILEYGIMLASKLFGMLFICNFWPAIKSEVS